MAVNIVNEANGAVLVKADAFRHIVRAKGAVIDEINGQEKQREPASDSPRIRGASLRSHKTAIKIKQAQHRATGLVQDPRSEDPEHHHRLRIQRESVNHHQIFQRCDGYRCRSQQVQLRQDQVHQHLEKPYRIC